ncbi:hypothetical protein PFISCL1PPCAC_8023 [Pristionchus fissidentatus]|uniref:Nuclear receptor n=1 Tax=Pristionchus fissidentatus TaxID=1538716 RepID=A0AAV5VAP2_9BILA|nr:hypothetical protein PFISCL1PPCAC_8023 [Pristionchus fissidentatus]
MHATRPRCPQLVHLGKGYPRLFYLSFREMDCQERRNIIFRLIEKIVQAYNSDEVLLFYRTIYDIYHEDNPESFVSSENLSKNEKEILRRFLRDAIFVLCDEYRVCVHSPWLRSILSGMAMLRIELLPILCEVTGDEMMLLNEQVNLEKRVRAALEAYYIMEKLQSESANGNNFYNDLRVKIQILHPQDDPTNFPPHHVWWPSLCLCSDDFRINLADEYSLTD